MDKIDTLLIDLEAQGSSEGRAIADCISDGIDCLEEGEDEREHAISMAQEFVERSTQLLADLKKIPPGDT